MQLKRRDMMNSKNKLPWLKPRLRKRPKKPTKLRSNRDLRQRNLNKKNVWQRRSKISKSRRSRRLSGKPKRPLLKKRKKSKKLRRKNKRRSSNSRFKKRSGTKLFSNSRLSEHSRRRRKKRPFRKRRPEKLKRRRRLNNKLWRRLW